MTTNLVPTTHDIKPTPTCDISLVYKHSLYPNYSFPYTNRLVVKFYNVKDMYNNSKFIRSNIITLGSCKCSFIGRTRIGYNNNGKDFECYLKLKPIQANDSQWIKACVNMTLKHNVNNEKDINYSIKHKFNKDCKYDIGYKFWTSNGSTFAEKMGFYKNQCLTFSVKFTIYKASFSQPHPVIINFANNFLDSKVIGVDNIVISGKHYSIFYDLVNQCCPMLLLDWTQGLITKANLLPLSLERFLQIIHHQERTEIDDFKIMLELKWLFMLCAIPFIELAKEYDDCMNKVFSCRIRDQIIGHIIDAFALTVLYPPFVKEFYLILQHFCTHFDLNEQFFEMIMQKFGSSHFVQFVTLCVTKSVEKIQIKAIEIPECKRYYDLDNLLIMLGGVTIPSLDPHNYDNMIIFDPELNHYFNLLPKPDFILSTVYGGNYKCHKWLLYARWRYFKNMLDFGGKETIENQMLLSEDCTNSRLQQLLRYIYTIECDFKLQEDALWLLQYGQYYGIIDSDKLPASGFERLVESCLEVILESKPALINIVGQYVRVGYFYSSNKINITIS